RQATRVPPARPRRRPSSLESGREPKRKEGGKAFRIRKSEARATFPQNLGVKDPAEKPRRPSLLLYRQIRPGLEVGRDVPIAPPVLLRSLRTRVGGLRFVPPIAAE